MKRDEILEYPYEGYITRTVENSGCSGDDEILIYSGEMDEHMVTDEEGKVMQTSSYIISIPLTTDSNGEWIVPIKGDTITLTRYGETMKFTVDNADPSQIGGVSIYAARNAW